MKFSLVGTGFIMPRHAEAIISTGGEIRDVVNTTHGENSWKDMVKKTDADCIVVLTPNDLHYPIAKTAIAAGKIVLVEKPLSFRSEEIMELVNEKNIFTVLQLKYHPYIKMLKEQIKSGEHHDVEMDISVYRDEKYHLGWKGQIMRSGGVLFNLGIHYFDLLIYLLGPQTEILEVNYSPKTVSGKFKGQDYTCVWRISVDERKDNQRRIFKIDGINYNFSSKDNLSYENLHREVYADLLMGRGVIPNDCLPTTLFIEEIYKRAGVSLYD